MLAQLCFMLVRKILINDLALGVECVSKFWTLCFGKKELLFRPKMHICAFSLPASNNSSISFSQTIFRKKKSFRRWKEENKILLDKYKSRGNSFINRELCMWNFFFAFFIDATKLRTATKNQQVWKQLEIFRRNFHFQPAQLTLSLRFIVEIVNFAI